MKKLYSIALAGALALSASAADDLRLHTSIVEKVNHRTAVEAPVKMNKAAGMVELIGGGALTPSKAPAEEQSVDGDYIITIGDYYFESSVNDDVEEECTVTLEGSKLTFSSPYFVSDVTAVYDSHDRPNNFQRHTARQG